MQTKVKATIAYVVGLLLVMAEPIFLLFKGEDIVNAIWPAAVRSLDLSFALRDNMGVFFGLMTFAILAIITARIVYSKSEFLQKKVSETNPTVAEIQKAGPFILLGYGTALAVLFALLNIAYLRGVFILLPAFYGGYLLISVLLIADLSKFKTNLKEINFHMIYNIVFVIVAVVLISPALPALIGIAPSPPEFEGAMEGDFSYTTTQHPYPMPSEVEEIIGDIEGDIDFSIYSAVPDELTDNAPMAILIHGFANPGYATYEDWAHVLASNGIATYYIQYPSDVWPETWDTYTAVYENGTGNYPHHVPRVSAITSALDYIPEILPAQVNTSKLYIGGHSLGAGYALVTMDLALERNWGNDSLFLTLGAAYIRPSQEEFAINTSLLPDRFSAHVVISEDDMTVDDCSSYHHAQLLGEKATLMTVQSDRSGYPRLVATHYLQAAETRDTLANWAFYRTVQQEAEWLLGAEDITYDDTFTSMGTWSNGEPVNPIIIHEDMSVFDC